MLLRIIDKTELGRWRIVRAGVIEIGCARCNAYSEGRRNDDSDNSKRNINDREWMQRAGNQRGISILKLETAKKQLVTASFSCDGGALGGEIPSRNAESRYFWYRSM